MRATGLAWSTRTLALGGALVGLAAWGVACADPLHIEPPPAPPGTGGQGNGGTGTGTAGAGGGAQTTCRSNSDCPAPTSVCDTVKQLCVECLVLSDCEYHPGTVCSEGSCVCPTGGESWCEPDLCVDLDTSPDHCGQCGHMCFGACASGACVDAWEPTAMVGAPAPRHQHVAVWTDTHMVVWGGSTSAGDTNTGGTYDPAALEWTATSLVDAPSPRREHTAVWTGSVMLVWGGIHNGPLDTGGRFDPSTNTWLPISTVNAPEPRYQHTAVWAGDRMIVWGGTGATSTTQLKTGASYDPATDTWETLTPAGPSLIERTGHAATWTGSLMLIYGGRYYATGWNYLPDGTNFAGLQYDPGASGPWSNLPSPSEPSSRAYHTAVMLDGDMVVWGGLDGSGAVGTGARYDTTGVTWSATNPPQPEARYYHTAVVLETTPPVMVVWGGKGDSGAELDSGGVYELSSNAWESTPTALSARAYHTAVSTGTSMIVWGGSVGGTLLGDGGIFTP